MVPQREIQVHNQPCGLLVSSKCVYVYTMVVYRGGLYKLPLTLASNLLMSTCINILVLCMGNVVYDVYVVNNMLSVVCSIVLLFLPY